MKKFIYVHIQKTAGTSLKDIFKIAYGEDRIYHDMTFKYGMVGKLFSKIEKCDRIVPNFNPRKFDIIIGHFTIKKYWHLNRPFITFLRDPVERVVSAYSIWRKAKENFDKPIAEYARICPNMMTKMVGGNLENFEFVGIVERYGESMIRLERLLGRSLNQGIRSNVTKRKYPKYIPTRDDRVEIRAFNKMDIELYLEAWSRL